MIIVKLMGGLGNQMFQYAAGRALALRHRTQLKLDLSFLNSAQAGHTHRVFLLNSFPIIADIASSSEISFVEHQINKPFVRRLMDLMKRKWPGQNFTILLDYDNVINRRFFTAGENTILSGYWQSEQYFIDVARQIRAELSPREPVDVLNCCLLDQINKINSVSVHVRRGDYVNNHKINSIHGVCSLSYYNQAMEFIAQEVQEPHFFVFTDDPEWTRKHLITQYPTTVVDHNSVERPHDDLFLMSACNHHIIANSSFSWWGAWLNRKISKIVIAPKRWFALPTHAAEGLVPQEWVRL